MDNQSNLESSELQMKQKKTQSKYFDVEDVEDVSFDDKGDNGDSPSSPTKLFNDQNQINLNVNRMSRSSRRRNAKSIKLEPFQGPHPHKIDINENDEKGTKKGVGEGEEKEQKEEDIKSDEDEGEVKIERAKKPNQARKKMLVFGEDEIEEQLKNEGSKKQREAEEGVQKIQERALRDESIIESEEVQIEDHRRNPLEVIHEDETRVQGLYDDTQIREILQPDEEIVFILKRDKEWYNKIRPRFHVHFQHNDEFFFSVKMTSSNATSTFILSRSKTDFEENGPNYIGKFKANFTGTTINIYGPGYNPENAKEKNLPLRSMLATVQYETNFFGATRPRNFKVFLLKQNVDYYSDLIGTKKFSEEVALSELYEKELNKSKILVFENRKPEWNDDIKGYMLNFNGKVKKASIKNFILQDEVNPENARIIFGKVTQDNFRLEIGHPFSPFLGVSIALSAFGSKIGCE